MPVSIPCVCVCLLVMVEALRAAEPLSIGWNYAGSTRLNAGDAAGAPGFKQFHWNNHAGSGQGPGSVPFPLHDGIGEPTTAAVTAWSLSANNSWQHTQTAHPDQILMNDFTNQQPSVTFSGIPYGSYAVVVYYGNNEGPDTSTLAVAARSRVITTGNTARSSFGAIGYKEGTDTNPDSPTNFTVFEGIIGSSVTVGLTGNNNNGISAVQIVEGEPVPESTTPATPAFPLDASSGFKPWQPLCWNIGGFGETGYDLYLWPEGSPKPGLPTAGVSGTTYAPNDYLSAATGYRWQVVTRLQSGGSLTSPEFTFTTGTSDGQPPFNISRAAQETRTAEIEGAKGIEALVTNRGGGYPIPDGTTLAFFGDSITDVFTYFDVLQSALEAAKAGDPSFPSVTVVNRGINGATTDDLLNLPDGDQFSGGGGPHPPLPFKQQIDADLAALAPGRIYVAVLQIGINDVLQGDNTPESIYKARLEEMTDYVLGKGHRVVLLTPTGILESPVADIVDDGLFDDAGNALLNQYAEALGEIARARDIPFVNQRAAFLRIYRNENFAIARDAAGTVTYPRTSGILHVDAVHPNPRGKALSSELTAAGILEAVTRARAPAPPEAPAQPDRAEACDGASPETVLHGKVRPEIE